MSHPESKPDSQLRILSLGIVILLALSAFLFPNSALAAIPNDVNDIGLIVNIGGIDDNGFNEMAVEGLTRAETDLGVNGTIYLSASPEDYPVQIAQCVTDGNVLCITIGYDMMDATWNAAGLNPGVNFAIVDVTWEDYPDNLRGITFASEQAGYLAGTLAGLMTTSKVIGAIGGMDIPPVTAFMLPYRYGAQWADHDVVVLFDYANDFMDPDLGAQLAQHQIDQGADVIFGVGGPMGNGAILYAAQAGKWVIGVDADAYYAVFDGGAVDGAEFLLTSALKRVDNAVYDTIADQIAGNFSSGSIMYDLSDEGVGLAPYHEAEASIPQDVQDHVTAVMQGILNGEIDVWEPWTYRMFLPAVVK